ncbi:hypothetical protein Tco_0841427 [Tanacetum coccineum]|uniref:Uncharacterized protein n=1 Tax=Tanacetum coccineum TaxID=301880 RepID=A0ABQ5AWB5_9ASTR
MSLSSDYGNQFLNVSFDVSLVVIIKEPVDFKVQSMVDVPITQASLAAQQIPSVDVITTMIQNTTPTPIPNLQTTTESQITVVSAPDPSATVLERLSALEKKVESLSKVDHSEAIEQSVQAKIINEVKNQLPKFLCQRSSESLFKYELKKILLEKMDKSRLFMSHEKHSDLYNGLLNSIMLDEAIASGYVNLDKVLRKRNHEYQDPPAGSDQRKKKKKRKKKDSEPSKKNDQSGS